MALENRPALDFMASRRSTPPALLRAPGPDAATLDQILTLAMRVPDHGKLEPWRLIVLGDAARARIGAAAEAASLAEGNPQEKAAKNRVSYAAPTVIAVVFSPVENAKIPEWEQFLSAGAVCLSLVNAAMASGFGASWLTGIAAGEDFARTHFGLSGTERIAGVVHIGTRADAPPDRPRPDKGAKVTRLD
ncbi:MAG: nitroreductase [Paracoccus sp. (in: a-proteobacteria)]|nr:nitroreductase [Paracoccus sp. (in: a-proteobacteria)]